VGRRVKMFGKAGRGGGGRVVGSQMKGAAIL